MQINDYAHAVQAILGQLELPTTDVIAIVTILFTTEDDKLRDKLTPSQIDAIEKIVEYEPTLEDKLDNIMTGTDQRIIDEDEDMFAESIRNMPDELDYILENYLDYRPTNARRTGILATAIFSNRLRDKLSKTNFSEADVEQRLFERGVAIKSNTQGQKLYTGLRPLTISEYERQSRVDEEISVDKGQIIERITGLRPNAEDTRRWVVKDVHNQPDIRRQLAEAGLKKKDIRRYFLAHGVREINYGNVRTYVGLEPVE